MGVVVRQSMKGTVLTYVGAAIGFVTQFFVVTKFLQPEIIGLTKVFVEVAAFCASLSLLGVCSTGMRFFPYFRNPSNGNNGFFFYYLALPLIGGVLVSGLYLLFKEPVIAFFCSGSDLFAEFYRYVIPLIFVLALWLALESYSNINLRIAVPKAVRDVLSRVLLMADYLLYAAGALDVTGLVIALSISYFVCLLTMALYVGRTCDVTLRHDTSFITPDLRSKVFRYSGFLVLASLTTGLMNQLDIFMLSSVKGMYSAGVYTIACYMANIVDMPSRSITSISTPLAAEALKESDTARAVQLYRQVSVHQMLISCTILLLIWVNIDNIFAVLPNGDKFAEGKYVVLLLGLSKTVFTTMNFGGILIQFSKYYRWTLFITVFLTVLSIGTNLFFIPRMGVSGAALATLIATILSYSAQQYIVQVKLHCNPFSSGTLKVLALTAALYGLNALLPSLSAVSPWLDIAVRTVFVAGTAAVGVYALKISEQVNQIIDKILHRV